MVYTRHPVNPYLLARLWANLWERGKEELSRIGLSLDEAFHEFLEYASQATDAGIVCADGEPILVCGVCAEGDTYHTFMEATEAFEQHKRQIVRVMRREVRKAPDPIYIYSTLVHKDAERFYGVLGFVIDPAWVGMTKPGFKLYRFKRRDSHVRK